MNCPERWTCSDISALTVAVNTITVQCDTKSVLYNKKISSNIEC